MLATVAPAQLTPPPPVSPRHQGDVEIDGDLSLSGSLTAANIHDRRDPVDPVFLIQNAPGAPWTDFELKGATNNFAAGHQYYYHSPDPGKTVVTSQLWPVRPAVFFTDSQAVERRAWIKQTNADAVYDLLASPSGSYVGGWLVYVRGMGLTRDAWEAWTWTYMLMDGAHTEDDPGGRSIWRITRPVAYVPAGDGPNL